MVHFHNAAVAAAAVTSVVLSSLAPGAQAAPAMPPLPMRQEARRSMLNSGDIDLEKRDLKIKGCFDPDHSLHYNYHHGCASEDGHGHGWHGAKERRTIDLEAIIQLNAKSQHPDSEHDKRSLLGLNLGGNNGILGGKDKKGILGGNGLGLNLKKRGEHIHAHGLSDRELERLVRKLGDNSHVHVHSHKAKRSLADEEDEEEQDDESDDELEKRSPEPRVRSPSSTAAVPELVLIERLSFFSQSRYRNSRWRHRHRHSHDHVHVHSHKRDEIEARDPRRHHHHDNDHDHVHVHSHKRDEIEESDDLEKRSKSQPKRMERKAKKSKGKKSSSKSAKSFSKKTDSKKSSDSKKSGSKKSKSSSSKKNKDAAAASSDKPAVSAGAKVSLGKRALEQAGVPGFVEVATPLFNSSLARTVAGLVFTANPDPSPNATTFVLGTSDAESTQFYLTTASNPDPSTPVELNVVNIRVPILDSQTLKVVDYCATFDLTPPSPLSLLPCGKKDGFSQNFAYNGTTGEIQPLYSTTPAPMALVSNKASQPSSSAQSFAATGSNSTASAQAEEEDPEDISLYFIPASTYYEAPADVNHLIDSHKNRTLAASASMADDSMTSTSASDDGMTSTSMDAEPTSTQLPSSTETSSAPESTMTAAPTDAYSNDDYSMDSSMDGSSMDGMSMDSSSMDSSMMDGSSMDDSMATPTDSMYSDETLSTSTVEPTASSTSTPLVNQNNAATPSSSMAASSASSSSSSSMATPSSAAAASSASAMSSMTPSGTPSASMSSTSTSTSASAAPTVTIQQSTDYTTPGMAKDPNAGIDANTSNYSPMARRRFARW
ncbi:hypothetical protein JCM11491_004462 [Sporobolomyces phaffii]